MAADIPISVGLQQTREFVRDTRQVVRSLEGINNAVNQGIKDTRASIVATNQRIQNLQQLADQGDRVARQELNRQRALRDRLTAQQDANKADRQASQIIGEITGKLNPLTARIKQYEQQQKSLLAVTDQSIKDSQRYKDALRFLQRELSGTAALERKLAENRERSAREARRQAEANRQLVDSYDRVGARVRQLRADEAKLLSLISRGTGDLSRHRTALSNLRQELQGLQSGASNAGNGFSGLAKKLGLLGAGAGIVRSLTNAFSAFAKEILRVTILFEGLESAFNAIFGSSQEAGKQFEFLKNLSNDLGLQFESLTQGYKQLTAAALGSNFSLFETQKLFKSVAGAARVLNLSNDEVKGSIRALSQILSKGKVFNKA